jgi:hypothetical protein
VHIDDEKRILMYSTKGTVNGIVAKYGVQLGNRRD